MTRKTFQLAEFLSLAAAAVWAQFYVVMLWAYDGNWRNVADFFSPAFSWLTTLSALLSLIFFCVSLAARFKTRQFDLHFWFACLLVALPTIGLFRYADFIIFPALRRFL